MATRPSLRVTMRRVHLWLGLTIGVLFAFAGLTGSLLVFYPEIDAALSPALRACRREHARRRGRR
ncbi:PepSY domain-containing protein [Sphingomonas aerolata]|uniref:PepSY domain-containing protein n=1 Tax=Sphingomonas aerolata TaxID=185951 RepID=UPI003A5C6046